MIANYFLRSRTFFENKNRIIYMFLTKIKYNYLIYFFLIGSMNGESIKYNKSQIVKLMQNMFSEPNAKRKLLGYHFYKDNDNMIFQIEIETSPHLANNDMIFSFRVINKLADVSKNKFTHAVVVLHFKVNALPIIAKSELKCSKKFFSYETYNQAQWRKNCLSIQNN